MARARSTSLSALQTWGSSRPPSPGPGQRSSGHPCASLCRGHGAHKSVFVPRCINRPFPAGSAGANARDPGLQEKRRAARQGANSQPELPRRAGVLRETTRAQSPSLLHPRVFAVAVRATCGCCPLPPGSSSGCTNGFSFLFLLFPYLTPSPPSVLLTNPVCPSICPFIYPLLFIIYPLIHLPFRLLICPSTRPPAHPSVHPFVHLFVYLPICPSVFPSTYHLSA